LWYVRSPDGGRQGPFPAAAVAQDLAVGRLPADVLVSADCINWVRAAETEAFADLLQPDASDAWAEERRRALRRWADERTGRERRTHPAIAGTRRAGGDRRQGGDDWSRPPRTGRLPRHGRAWVVIGGLALLLGGLVALAMILGPGSTPEIRLLK
jgi:hypothetical protein